MAYELPAGIVLGGAILGIALDSFDVVDKVARTIIPPKINIEENYLMFPLRNVFSRDSDDRVDGSEFIRNFGKEISSQMPEFRFVVPNYIDSLFSIDLDGLTTAFCESHLEEIETSSKSVEQCVSETRVEGELATYSIVNRNAFPISDVSITLQKYVGDGVAILNLDRFVDDPEERDGCLYTSTDEKTSCFAAIDGAREIQKLPQSIQPGERLIIPIFMGFSLSYRSNEGGEEIYFYDGFTSSPFWLPISVEVASKAIVAKARPMSPTPIITPGEYEIRG